MDDKEFLSYFWNLSENTNSKEKILEFSEKIVNSVIAKQKFEKHESNSTNKEKYSNYLKVYFNPCDDLLYLFKRLVGGILSTGLDMRKGFVITFQMLLDRLSDVNFVGLIEAIEKESIFSKSEKVHIKNCIYTGKILLYKTILSVKSVGLEDILQIFKNMTDLLIDKVKIIEDPILLCFDQFFNNVYNNYYTELQENSNQKQLSKFIDKTLNLLVKLKKNINDGNTSLSEYGIMLILDKYASFRSNLKKTSFLYQFSSSFDNFVGKQFESNFFQNTNLEMFFTSLLRNKRDKEFNLTYDFLVDNLKEKKNNELCYNVWNFLIDSETRDKLSEVSLKNYQFLLFKYSLFLINNFFVLKYVSQIFDDSFLFSLMNFTSDKKIIYLKQILEAVLSKLEEIKTTQTIETSEYCFLLINIFGSDKNFNISPNTFKHFFISLFNLLSKEKKNEYIENLVRSLSEEEELDEEISNDKKSLDNVIFRISALKQLVLNKSVVIEEEQKDKVIDYFLIEYFNNNHKILTEIIEERLLFIILNHSKSNIKEGKESQHINNLIQFNKTLQTLIKSKRIEGIDQNDYKVYLKLFKSFNDLYKNNNKLNNKRFYMILSISFLILIIYLKNVTDFEEILADLYESAKNLTENVKNNDWEKILTDLIIDILAKGKLVLNEYVSTWMKKVSKDLGYDSCSVLLQFLKEDIKDEPNRMKMMEDIDNNENDDEKEEEINEENEIQMEEDS